MCGVDQADVRKRLREIAQLAPRSRIVLLRQQTHVVTDREQTLEDGARLVIAPRHRQVIGKPKGTGQKGALAALQPVDALLRGITPDQSVRKQFALDGLRRFR